MNSKSKKLAVYDWLYEYGFIEMEAAYRATMDSLQARHDDVEARARTYHGLKPDEPVPDPVYDDEGDAPWEFWEEVGEQQRGIRRSADIVRMSFAVALFHYFEKHAADWVPVIKGKDHLQEVENWLTCRGFTPEMATIRELKLVANILKHGPGDSAKRLFKIHPEMFEQVDLGPKINFKPSDKNLIITKENLERYFRAVTKLGPRARRPWDEVT